MDTTFTTTPSSPDTMLIGGREHVLYLGFFEPLKIVDKKILWVYSLLVWVVALFTVVLVFTWDVVGPWGVLAIIAMGVTGTAVGAFLDHHSGVTTPVAIKEKERSDTWSRMVISTRHHNPLTVTAHREMADFLLATVAEGQTGRFVKRPRVPVELRNADTQRHVWIVAAGMAIGGPAYAVLLVGVIAALI